MRITRTSIYHRYARWENGPIYMHVDGCGTGIPHVSIFNGPAYLTKSQTDTYVNYVWGG